MSSSSRNLEKQRHQSFHDGGSNSTSSVMETASHQHYIKDCTSSTPVLYCTDTTVHHMYEPHIILQLHCSIVIVGFHCTDTTPVQEPASHLYHTGTAPHMHWHLHHNCSGTPNAPALNQQCRCIWGTALHLELLLANFTQTILSLQNNIICKLYYKTYINSVLIDTNCYNSSHNLETMHDNSSH